MYVTSEPITQKQVLKCFKVIKGHHSYRASAKNGPRQFLWYTLIYIHSKKSQTNQLGFTYSKALRSINLSESSRCLLLEIWGVFCYFSEVPFTYMNFVLIWLGLFILCHLCKHALKWCSYRLICLGWNFTRDITFGNRTGLGFGTIQYYFQYISVKYYTLKK